MSELNSTLLSVLLVLGSGLIVTIIIVISRITRTVAELQAELTRTTQTVLPLVERINALTASVEQTLAVVNENRQAVAETVDYMRGITRNVYRLQQIVVDRIEPPLLEFASIVSSVTSGLKSFTDTWRRGRGA
ncbi:MAG: hypothetical protein HY962_13285 [Ignavibacteriae bacterium]|nr:hypothetical protein [Ignavibacteriota bacterium]